MDELTLLRDVHHVAPPSAELVERERAALAALIVSAGPAVAPITAARRKRRVRRVVVAGVLGAGVLAGVGAAAAGGLLDRTAADLVDSVADCGFSSADGRLVASAIDGHGSTIEFWRFDTPGGVGDMVVEKLPDGTYAGSMLGCDNSYSRIARIGERRPTASAALVSDDHETLMDLYGWVPQPATVAVVSLDDGTTVTAAANAEGYFLQPITLAPNPYVALTHIQALAADGTVVAEADLP